MAAGTIIYHDRDSSFAASSAFAPWALAASVRFVGARSDGVAVGRDADCFAAVASAGGAPLFVLLAGGVALVAVAGAWLAAICGSGPMG
jgi:hypothetical protein